ncbi:uncharacterized protein [Dysidea avara]|uniref:uncharacterized protein n=1 Tax=Dysidea avara TaxID=196820 RepID=UPI0033234564
MVVKMEEQICDQQIREIKINRYYQEMMKKEAKLLEKQIKELKLAHQQNMTEYKAQHTTEVAEQQSTAIKTQVSLKTKIACKETLIRQNQEKYRHNIVKMKDTKMMELNETHSAYIQEMKKILINESDKVEKQHKTELMNQYKCTMADEKTQQENEIEELLLKFNRGLQIERQLTEGTALLESGKEDISQLITENRAKFLNLHDINTHLKKITKEIDEYEEQLQDELDKVKRKHDITVTQLTKDRTDLRKQLLSTTDWISKITVEKDKRVRRAYLKATIEGNIKKRLQSILKSSDEVVEKELKLDKKSATYPTKKK